MFKSNGYNLSDIAAVTGGNRNYGDGMFGDNGAWWIIILFLLTGWGRNGNGAWGGEGSSCATQTDVREAVDQQTLISKLDQQTYGLADSTYALNNAITSGFHGVDTAVCNLGYQVQQGFNTLGYQMKDCCCHTDQLIERGLCDIGRTVERGFADTNYNMATQACDTRRAIADGTRDIIENQNNGFRSLMDFFVQDKISTLQSENQALKFAASQQAQNAFISANQEAQTAELIRRLSTPCPVPAYVVPNPNCCYGNYGFFDTGCYNN